VKDKDMVKTTQDDSSSYDAVPYLEISHSSTHPDNLARVAVVLGLTPADVRHCRVLELGCAAGSNLIPMAVGLPGSSFVGLDASSLQIARGQEAINALKVNNVCLKHLDITNVSVDLGKFDYIIAHGVFSWVPEAVRDKILSICDQNLASNGIAYVSYNTFPGWYQQRVVRDMMLYHTRNVIEPAQKIAKARQFLNFMADSVESANNLSSTQTNMAYAGILMREKERLGSHSDSYLFHEELEETNDPLYFFQFAEWAKKHGLQYLAEASADELFMNTIPAGVRDALAETSVSLIELEQNVDFFKNRVFRKTLLVHQSQTISRRIDTDRISNLFVASGGRPVSASPDIHSRSVEQFASSARVKLATDHPASKAAMLCLSEIWPQVVPVRELLNLAYARLARNQNPGNSNPTREDRLLDEQVLRANLLKGFLSDDTLVEMHVYAPEFSTELSKCPLASPWARFQVELSRNRAKKFPGEKKGHVTVTNLRHEQVELEGLAPYILSNLDGGCTRDDILANLTKLLMEGRLAVESLVQESQLATWNSENRPVIDIDQAKKMLAKDLDAGLFWLARAALLQK
jgi:methyltransferase-like protein/cyclopropane fatty-acyl-phospholipid synthase-like methyltransferase